METDCSEAKKKKKSSDFPLKKKKKKKGTKISEGLLVITLNLTFSSKEKQPLTALRVNLAYLRPLQKEPKGVSDLRTCSKRLQCLPPVLAMFFNTT